MLLRGRGLKPLKAYDCERPPFKVLYGGQAVEESYCVINQYISKKIVLS